LNGFKAAATSLREEFSKVPLEEKGQLSKDVKVAMSNTRKVLEEMDKIRPIPKERRAALAVQIAIAMYGKGEISNIGITELANKIRNNDDIMQADPEQRHPYNFKAAKPGAKEQQGYRVIRKIEELFKDDEKYFRDHRRDPRPADKLEVDASQTDPNGVLRCFGCNEPFGDGLLRKEYDHWEEWSDGGRTTPYNLVAVHFKCHRTPAYRLEEEKAA
jgi:hypothetical protein